MLQTCLGPLEIQRQKRRAVHGQGAASEPPCTTKAGIQRLSLRCKIKNTIRVKKRRRGVLEKMAHQTLSKKPAITTPHTFGNVPQKCSNKKFHTNSETPFLKTAAKLLTKEIRSVMLHVETEQRETVHTHCFFPFPNHMLISSPFRQSLLAAMWSLLESRRSCQCSGQCLWRCWLVHRMLMILRMRLKGVMSSTAPCPAQFSSEVPTRDNRRHWPSSVFLSFLDPWWHVVQLQQPVHD